MVATSQPLAVQAGLEILKSGGNAVDAAIAATAVLHVVQPMSTGLGGDLFAIVYHAESKELFALNASGYAPKRATIEEYTKRGFKEMPQEGILSVTVPGAPRGWEELLKRFGTKPLKELLRPAIEYAKEGFPVTEKISSGWQTCEGKLKQHEEATKTYLIEGRAPRPRERFRNPRLARTFELLAQDGIEAFYEGEIAQEIVEESQRLEGLLSLEDLKSYQARWVEPIGTSYRGTTIYELPPNTQGLVALLALNIIEGFDLKKMGRDSVEYLHVLIEVMKLAFADGRRYIADPDFEEIPLQALLSKDYAAQRRDLIRERALPAAEPGSPEGGTVYVTVVDEERNVVSFIESIFMPFGSGVTVRDTGIILQNRGALFTLDPEHPNCLAPRKRPYHTIMPAMAFLDGRPWLSFGVVGGFMQPQGHLQLLCNLIDHGMGVQEAIDAPRFRFYEGNRISLEEGIAEDVREGLERRGHELIRGEGGFGGAQVIAIDPENGMLLGGSDCRQDGCAQGY
jgi:gamma-glutamyltranspeptidase/glutathione hydrolase